MRAGTVVATVALLAMAMAVAVAADGVRCEGEDCGGRRYEVALLEVCGCKLNAYPEVKRFMRDYSMRVGRLYSTLRDNATPTLYFFDVEDVDDFELNILPESDTSLAAEAHPVEHMSAEEMFELLASKL